MSARPTASLVLVLTLALGSIAGCGGEGEPQMDNLGKAPPEEIPAAKPGTSAPVVATPATPDEPGMPAAPGDLDLREALPDDVAVYPDVTPLTFVRKSDGNVLTSFSIDADPSEVTAWYTTELEKQGWTVESLPGGPEAQHAVFAEKGDRLLSLFIGEEEGRQVAELSVSKTR